MDAQAGNDALPGVLRTLRACRLFQGVPVAWVRRVAAFTIVKHLARGDYLFHQGSPVHGVFIVRRGAVRLHRVNSFGREQTIHVFRPVESFGEESLVAAGGCLADACATEPAEVLLVQRRGLLALLKRQPELALCLLRAMEHHVQLLIGLLDDLTLKDVKTRFALWLLHHCPDPASPKPIAIHLPGTKRVLAAELGTVSETLSRTVAKFRDWNLLAVRGSSVTLLNPRRLARWVTPPRDLAGLPAGATCGATVTRG
jgi:CRP/FNR family transcriptional regulator